MPKGFFHVPKAVNEPVKSYAANSPEKTIGTMEEFLKISTLKEFPGKYESSKHMITELLSDHESVIVKLRKDINESADKNKDAGTADFLTGLLEQHETTAWILRRYLN